jgi:hypothetical protein
VGEGEVLRGVMKKERPGCVRLSSNPMDCTGERGSRKIESGPWGKDGMLSFWNMGTLRTWRP